MNFNEYFEEFVFSQHLLELIFFFCGRTSYTTFHLCFKGILIPTLLQENAIFSNSALGGPGGDEALGLQAGCSWKLHFQVAGGVWHAAGEGLGAVLCSELCWVPCESQARIFLVWCKNPCASWTELKQKVTQLWWPLHALWAFPVLGAQIHQHWGICSTAAGARTLLKNGPKSDKKKGKNVNGYRTS